MNYGQPLIRMKLARVLSRKFFLSIATHNLPFTLVNGIMFYNKGTTMVLLSIKLPDELAQELGIESQALHITKGAVVREALALYLSTRKSTLADQIQSATEVLRKGKTHKKDQVDWQNLRERCRGKSKLKPEAEVLAGRTRGLAP